ncbi:hypothetical protein AXG93_868s1650 [Marchantia polymorpha subsp. ruderalis]|uniref:Uncharacterized protein n=1 Tax=Marchantia polymorpha subsp. ruderalis TaxID=1480154 RepID=A0A176VNF5_MARPO|nr:hypothetical protein AXG93_868s1650 [Marchantia polymorpha subsp. ruderalis]
MKSKSGNRFQSKSAPEVGTSAVHLAKALVSLSSSIIASGEEYAIAQLQEKRDGDAIAGQDQEETRDENAVATSSWETSHSSKPSSTATATVNCIGLGKLMKVKR